MKVRQQKLICLIVVSTLQMCFLKTTLADTTAANVPAIPPETTASIWHTTDIPKLLGWNKSPVSRNNLCGGYYQDPLSSLIGTSLPPYDTTPVNISADQSTIHQVGTSVLVGEVTMTQPGRSIHSDQAYVERDPETHALSNATLVGNVEMREPGSYVVGDRGHIEFGSKVTHFFHAFYHFMVGAFSPGGGPAGSAVDLTAWGKANSAEQDKNGIIILHQTTYTTCSPNISVWKVRADSVTLNRDTGRGVARDAWLDVKDVPVFYTPYLNFPIDDRRQSGFLSPTFSSSSTSGYSIGLPYYWNIAPNYDDLFTPRVYSLRGLQLNDQFRYLTQTSNGIMTFGYLPQDKAFSTFKQQSLSLYPATNPLLGQLQSDSDNRSFLSWQDNTVFDQRWNGNVNYNFVSDSYYYEDFNQPITLTQNQLPQQAGLNYLGDNWVFNGQLQGFQTLHPINLAAVTNPYTRLPELDFNGNFPNEPGGFNYQLLNQFVYFTRGLNPGEVVAPPNTGAPNAARINIEPGISYPYTTLASYVTPKLQMDLTHYNIGNQLNGYASAVQRNIPIFDIDSGLYFDRDASWFGTDYQQTLEPRLFYLYVPYRNQDNIPLFDTALIPFTYDSLFLTNRFSGYDLIGDANQISAGLTTRFLDENTGAEKFHASIGEIYYFWDRRISSCTPQGTPAFAATQTVCTNPLTLVGATSPTEKTSPIAGQLSYYFNPHWSATGNVAWDPYQRQTVSSNVNFQYLPEVNHVFNATYNFVRFGNVINSAQPLSSQNDLNQLGFSFAWPVRQNWVAVGGWNYNISQQYSQTYFYGLEYDSCCWAARVVAGRTFLALTPQNTPTFNNAVYLQWQFKGLGTVGSADPTAFLAGSVPGYQGTF